MIARISEIRTPQKMSCNVKPNDRLTISETLLLLRLTPQSPRMNFQPHDAHWARIGRSRPSFLRFSAMNFAASREVRYLAVGSKAWRIPQKTINDAMTSTGIE